MTRSSEPEEILSKRAQVRKASWRPHSPVLASRNAGYAWRVSSVKSRPRITEQSQTPENQKHHRTLDLGKAETQSEKKRRLVPRRCVNLDKYVKRCGKQILSCHGAASQPTSRKPRTAAARTEIGWVSSRLNHYPGFLDFSYISNALALGRGLQVAFDCWEKGLGDDTRGALQY